MATPNPNEPEKVRNIVCFFIFGVISLVYDETSLVAAQDILAGSVTATTAVILAIALPVLFVKLTAPWFMQKFSYASKVTVILVLFISGLLIIISVHHAQWRLLGVSVLEVGVASSEITFLALTAYYQDVTVSAFVGGVGFASLLGPLYYTGLTTWSCVPPRIALLTTIPWAVVPVVCFVILDKSNISTRFISRKEERQGHKYSPLRSSGEGELPASTSPGLSWTDKWLAVKEIAPQITVLYVTYTAEYLSNHGVITTIAFSSSPFNPRDHYLYYLLCYQMGKFLGRSHMFFVSCTCPKMFPYVRVRKTWILALVEMFLLLLFIFDSWFRFVPHVSVILILCLIEGLTAGAVYINAAHNVSDAIDDPVRREFALGILTLGNATGKVLAGLLGLHVESLLKEHCLYKLKLDGECFTRYSKNAGWLENVHCQASLSLNSTSAP